MIYQYLKNIVFAYPLVLTGLILLPAMWYWYKKKNNRSQPTLLVSSAYAFRVKSWKNRFRHFPFVLRLLGVAALVIALARPQKKHAEQETNGEGIDIVLCMDVSGSMGSPDIPPSRMEVAKEMAEEFVRSRPVDRIGLVIFSGESFTQCPVTSDRMNLIGQIRMLESRKYLDDGTVIGEGLATSVDRLRKSQGKSKVIILLTDGKEDPPETRLIDPLTALDIAKTAGVKVYTIGVSGAPEQQPVANPKRNGRPSAGADFLDEQLLQKIAGETGGQYYRARDREGLQKVYKQIDQLEKSKIETRNYTRAEEMFLPFVLVALGLVFLEMILKFTLFRRFP